MKRNAMKKIAISLTAICISWATMAQELKQTNPTSANFVLDFNWILLCIAFILILPIYITSKTFLYALKTNLVKRKEGSCAIKKTGLLLLILGSSTLSQAQTFNAIDISSNWLSWILTGVIGIEALLIILFSFYTIKLLGPENENDELKSSNISKKSESLFTKIWNKINRFKPISEENNIDTGHEYDGIRELNNVIPPWFTTTFVLTILFAGVYLYRYHIAKSAPLQAEEFNIEMIQAEEAKKQSLAKSGDIIDENNVKLLGQSDISDGKKLFIQICASCHNAHGGSMPSGVGPNLTDDYWIHGGSVKDIFKSIKYGWPEKGMISWQNNFSPKQIAQLSSFIKSIAGSNPAGAKEPQGDLSKE